MYFFHEIRERLQRWFGQSWFVRNVRVRRLTLGALFLALLTLLLSTQVAPQRLDIQVGQVAPRDLVAPYDMVNRVATAQARQAAMDAIPMQQKTDPDVLRSGENAVDSAFAVIESVRAMTTTDMKSKSDLLASRLNLGVVVQPETVSQLLTIDDKTLGVAKQDAMGLLTKSLSGRVGKTDVTDLRDKVDRDSTGYVVQTTDPWIRSFIKELVKVNIRPNQVDDQEATDTLRKAAATNVPAVIWNKDRWILRKGEIVTQEQYEMLADLHLVGPRADFRALIGTLLFSLVVVTLVGLYLWRYRKDLLEQDSKLLLIGIIGVATLLLSLLMKAFGDSLGPGVGYLMPVAVSPMLLAILLDPKVALLQGAFLAVVTGLFTSVNQLQITMVALVGSTVAVYAVARVESRTDIYRAGLLVSAANVVTIIAIYLMKAASLLELQPWIDAALGALNGIIVAVLVTGALPFFETIFGVLTPLKLLELSNPNHPLLKKLLVEAPGSYHHTILVSNLCEAAAEAIGADQVLARVGAYYHDIGKTKRPYFFVENQFGGENPHDKLPPSLSALIITSHVKDGLEMAREARLPREITDFIPEHHGTTLVSYFYYMAKENGRSEYVLEDAFRYEGPKPHRKETAICMLADACEASVRAMRQGHLTVDQIESQVKRIIDDRLRQGQLENSDLTLRELDVIGKTFVRVLSGVHHARVEYPAEALSGSLPAKAGPTADPSEEEEVRADLDQQRSGESDDHPGAGADGKPGGGEGSDTGESPRG